MHIATMHHPWISVAPAGYRSDMKQIKGLIRDVQHFGVIILSSSSVLLPRYKLRYMNLIFLTKTSRQNCGVWQLSLPVDSFDVGAHYFP
jgi:hypothetical protein